MLVGNIAKELFHLSEQLHVAVLTKPFDALKDLLKGRSIIMHLGATAKVTEEVILFVVVLHFLDFLYILLLTL